MTTGKTIETVYSLRDEVTARLNKISAAFSGARKDNESASAGIEQANLRTSASFASLAKAVGGFRAAIAAVGTAVVLREIAQGVASIVNAGEKFDDLAKKFTTAFGSVAEGGAALEKVRALAKDVPFSFEQMSAAAVELKKRGLDPLDGTLQALVDNVVANDGSFEDLSETISALGKASLKGEVGVKALVSLTEKGVPVFALLGKALGKTEEEIRAMAASGQLGANEIKLLVAELGKLRAGAAAAEVGDLDAQLIKFRDTLQQVQADIAADGSLEAVRSAFQRVNKALSDLATSPEFKRLEESISGAIEGGAQAFENLFDNIDFGQLANEFGVITEAIRVMVNALGAADVVLEPLLKVVDKLTTVNELMITLARAGLLKLADGLEYVAQSSAKAAEKLGAPINPLTALRDEIEAGKQAFEGFALGVQTAIAAKDGLSVAAKQMVADLGALDGSAADARTKIAALFADVANTPNTGLGDIALALGQIGSESVAASENVKNGLRAELEKLSGPDLLRFQTAATEAFAKFNTSAAESANVLYETLFVAMERLGVAGESLGVAFTKSGIDIISTFKAVATNAYSTAAQIEAAFSAALANVTTTAEAEALGEALKRAGEQGKVGLDGMARSAVELRNRILELANAADPLADSFKRLGITAQKELDRIAETARGDFQAIRDAARNGGASLDDVSRAFEAMARAQLASVANASEFERKQVQAALKAQGAAMGLTDVLVKLGIVGETAGDRLAGGANRGADALRDAADAARDAASAAESVASANDESTQSFIALGSAAGQASFEIAGVSEKFRQLAEQQTGRRASGGGRESNLFEDLQEQSRLLEEEVARTRELNAQYDETEMRVRRLRGQYDLLADERLRQLAEEQRRFEENQKRQEEELERKRQQALERAQPGNPVTPRPTSTPSPTGTAGGITVNFAPNVFGDIPTSTVSQWARQLDKELQQIYRRRG